MIRISSSLKPASRKRSAMMASPSSTGGLNTCPRSLPQTVCAAPTARVAAKSSSHVHLPVYGVVSARWKQRAALRQRDLIVGAELVRRELGVGHDDRLDPGRDRRVDDRERLRA